MKKILIITALTILTFNSAADAMEGEIVFRDSLYGAAIGALLGTAFYLADDDDFAQKLATGVIIGTIAGLAYGLYETRSFVEIQKDELKFAVPSPVIQKKDDDILYSASILKTRF